MNRNKGDEDICDYAYALRNALKRPDEPTILSDYDVQ
jgi:hypothetical protein